MKRVDGSPHEIVKRIDITSHLAVALNGRNEIVTLIDGKEFSLCRKAVATIPIDAGLESIDQMMEKYRDEKATEEMDKALSKEDELFVHASNLEGWVLSGYDPRAIHTNLAFPLLSGLSRVDTAVRDNLLYMLEDRWKNGSDDSKLVLSMQFFRQLLYLARNKMIDFQLSNDERAFIEKQPVGWFFDVEHRWKEIDYIRDTIFEMNAGGRVTDEKTADAIDKQIFPDPVEWYLANEARFSNYAVSSPFDYVAYMKATTNGLVMETKTLKPRSSIYQSIKHFLSLGLETIVPISIIGEKDLEKMDLFCPISRRNNKYEILFALIFHDGITLYTTFYITQCFRDKITRNLYKYNYFDQMSKLETLKLMYGHLDFSILSDRGSDFPNHNTDFLEA